MYDLNLLIKNAYEFLEENRYSQSTISHHVRAWNRLRQWYDESGYQHYDYGVQQCYFKEAGLDKAPFTKHRKEVCSRVQRLISITETGCYPKREAARVYIVPEGFVAACSEYEGELIGRGLKSSTIQGYLSAVRHFCSVCGVSSPNHLAVISVTKFTESITDYAPQTRSGMLYIVRGFTRYLAEQGACAAEVADSMPLIPGHKHSSTPSAYSTAELSALLDGQITSSCLHPKRDRAIMVLAALLGMRASDIKALKLSDINWQNMTLSFVQQKTQVRQVLPMPEEVWLSLAGYLRDERPDIDSEYVFITACAPYHPIKSFHVFHRSVARAFKNAGIDTKGKRHGLHSLRHSTAFNMLADGTPYPTISAVLGHSSTNVTRRYLSIDVESLRDIALEVPQCRR